MLSVFAAASGALLLVTWFVVRKYQHQDFFFDEMWRVDIIRSADPLAHFKQVAGAPVPLGWILLHKALAVVLPHGAFGLRVTSLFFFAVGLTILAYAVRAILDSGVTASSRLTPWIVGAATALLLAIIPTVTALSEYFQNYLFEVAFAAALLLAAVRLPTRRWAFPTLLILIAVSPLFVLSPLFLLPILVVVGTRWAWQQDQRRKMLTELAAACAVATVLGSIMYFGFYRPVVDAGLKSFWAAETLRSSHQSLAELLLRSARQVRSGILQDALPNLHGVGNLLASSLLVVSAIAGFVVLSKCWIWYAPLFFSAWLFAIAASAVVDWPMTPVRVNLGVFVLVYAAIIVGFFSLVALLATSRFAPVAIVVVGGALFIALWPTLAPAPDGAKPFAVGLAADLGVVEATSSPANLVIAYHEMSKAYVHDRLVNHAHPGRTFHIVYQRSPADPVPYRPLDKLIARWLPDGGTVWCVMPHEIGADAAGRACRFTSASVTKVLEHPGLRAVILEYRASSAAVSTG